MNIQQIEANLIFKSVVGSALYGTATEESDTDYFGICIPTKDFVLGIKQFEIFEQRTNPSNSTIRNTKVDNDFTVYSLQKFIKLASANNPNILEVFFTPENNTLVKTEEMQTIFENRHLFISKKLYHKFSGYAHSQKRKLITKQPEGARTEYIKKYGYDVKYASHLLRLLYFGIELLQTGNLVFPAEYRKLLTQVKRGEWSLSFVLDKATFLEKYLDECLQTSALQEIPDFNKINSLQIKLIEQHWKKQIQFS